MQGRPLRLEDLTEEITGEDISHVIDAQGNETSLASLTNGDAELATAVALRTEGYPESLPRNWNLQKSIEQWQSDNERNKEQGNKEQAQQVKNLEKQLEKQRKELEELKAHDFPFDDLLGDWSDVDDADSNTITIFENQEVKRGPDVIGHIFFTDDELMVFDQTQHRGPQWIASGALTTWKEIHWVHTVDVEKEISMAWTRQDPDSFVRMAQRGGMNN